MEETKRKTMLLHASTQQPGKCSGCLQSIIWTFTKIGMKMPMNDGFQVVEYVPEITAGGKEVTMMRVFCEESHFVTCSQAARFKRGKAA